MKHPNLYYQGSILLKIINVNTSMDKLSCAQYVWGEITCPFPNFIGCTAEVWEWMSNLISHFMMYVITQSWD